MRTLTTLLLFASPTGALAHWGHIGEVAGHGHWVAVGVILVGGAIAGLLGKVRDEPREPAPEDGKQEGVEGLEEEPA